MAPNLGIADGRANLCLAAASFVALSSGMTRGVVTGFALGLFYDLVTTGPVGLMSFELTLLAFLLGAEGRNRVSEDWIGSVRLFAIGCVAVELVYAVAMCAVGGAGSFIQVLGLRTIPSVLLDALAFLAVGFFARGGRVAPSPLGSRKAGPRRGGARFRTKGL